jgi:hypothetical protein
MPPVLVPSDVTDPAVRSIADLRRVKKLISHLACSGVEALLHPRSWNRISPRAVMTVIFTSLRVRPVSKYRSDLNVASEPNEIDVISAI